MNHRKVFVRRTYVNIRFGGDEMACVFCGSNATFSAPPGVKDWICNSCMKHLAGKLHDEGCIKKYVDRNGSGGGRGGA